MKISKGVTGFTILYFVLLPLVLTALFGGVNCQGDGGETDDNDNPAAVDYVTQVLYERFANSSSFLTPDVIKTFSFCIKNVSVNLQLFFDFLCMCGDWFGYEFFCLVAGRLNGIQLLISRGI